MSLLLFDVELRRGVANRSLAGLAQSLRAELQPLIHGPLVIPEGKALLTRVGGRCEFDGTLLEFDPWSPQEHRCRQCQRVFTGQAHHDWWAMGAQLWSAERAVQGAALHFLRDDRDAGAVALRTLEELAARYQSWPNRDNVLGPTRPFFSTYLESIWLLNLCHAISLLESAGVDESGARTLSTVREQLVAPSRELIASYNEGRSNRQVWNEVAILSASRVLDDARAIERRLDSPHGLHHLIATGLLDDGTWYEGENYHLFAHRGLWYGVQLLRALGRPLDASLDARYSAGFVTPFLGVLPDDCLPSRRDSQYAVSIRQWRFAEWCELGIAHASARDGTSARADARLTGTLQRLYQADPDGSLQRQARHPYSTADAERNEPAGLLSRADLSWRALLMADAELPQSKAWSPGSVCLPSQGLAVIRREQGQMYVALEGGHTGGGHGHPDRLALTLQRGPSRWLEDPGTGSYVERKLHWYRSTLAHAAPLIDGASQDAVPAELLAFEDRGWAGWIRKRVANMKPGVAVERTVVVCEGHIIDVLEWHADRDVQIDLPIVRSVDACSAQNFERADAGGGAGLEDGFDFLVDAEVDRGVNPAAGLAIAGDDAAGTDSLAEFQPDFGGLGFHRNFAFSQNVAESRTRYGSQQWFEIWRATAPGAPGKPPEPLHWLRTRGRNGRLFGLWLTDLGSRTRIEYEPLRIVVTDSSGTTAVHSETDTGWHIDLTAAGATSSIDLVRLPHVSAPDTSVSSASTSADRASPAQAESAAAGHGSVGPAIERARVLHAIPQAPEALAFELGEAHYLQTEQSWAQADKPRALVTLSKSYDKLRVHILTQTGSLIVPGLDTENELDNERREVNSDGVQLYIGPAAGKPWTAAWLAVPAHETSPGLRLTPLLPDTPRILTAWSAAEKGWAANLRIPLALVPIQDDGTFALEVIINERPGNRVRRRGQLVLSGGGGFSYLRGDRTESTHALTFVLRGR